MTYFDKTSQSSISFSRSHSSCPTLTFSRLSFLLTDSRKRPLCFWKETKRKLISDFILAAKTDYTQICEKRIRESGEINEGHAAWETFKQSITQSCRPSIQLSKWVKVYSVTVNRPMCVCFLLIIKFIKSLVQYEHLIVQRSQQTTGKQYDFIHSHSAKCKKNIFYTFLHLHPLKVLFALSHHDGWKQLLAGYLCFKLIKQDVANVGSSVFGVWPSGQCSRAKKLHFLKQPLGAGF